MTRLSVNINKIALIRNSRDNNIPDVLQWAREIESFGADGITVHPRPDQRHIRYEDVRELKKHVRTELNVEGNPKEKKFVELVLEVCPHQVTLVPDDPGQKTSDHGWDTIREHDFLKEMNSLFCSKGIRVSVFVDPVPEMIEGAARTGIQRVELYTENYAKNFSMDPEKAVQPYWIAASKAQACGLELNAGHDLNLKNLGFLLHKIPFIREVSIGHALIADALYYGMENTVRLYKREIEKVYQKFLSSS